MKKTYKKLLFDMLNKEGIMIKEVSIEEFKKLDKSWEEALSNPPKEVKLIGDKPLNKCTDIPPLDKELFLECFKKDDIKGMTSIAGIIKGQKSYKINDKEYHVIFTLENGYKVQSTLKEDLIDCSGRHVTFTKNTILIK